MTRPPTTRAPLAHVAAGVEVRPDPEVDPRSKHSATQRAVIESVCRISELCGQLAVAMAALVQNLEAAVAVGTEQSDMLDVVPPVPEAPPKSELLTTANLAEVLQCDARTLRRRELAGALPEPIRTGRGKRWRRADIDRWLGERAGNSR